MTGLAFTPKRQPTKAERRNAERHARRREAASVAVADLPRIAAAAASMAMRGEAFSPDDRADAASQLVLDVLTTARAMADAAALHPVGMGGDVNGLESVPASLATVSTLYLAACNYRRSLERQRTRDAADAATGDAFTTGGDTEPVRPCYTPAEAHEKARAMLGALGLPRLGKLYPVAYAASRVYVGRDGHGGVEVSDADMRAVAAELGGQTPERTFTYRAAKAAERVPSASAYGVDAHLSALGVTPEPTAPARATPLPETFGVRTAPGHRFPNAPAARKTVPAAPVTVSRRRPRKSNAAPQWARDLKRDRPTAAARLAKADELRRERAAAADPAERAAARLAAGLPATVR